MVQYRSVKYTSFEQEYWKLENWNADERDFNIIVLREMGYLLADDSVWPYHPNDLTLLLSRAERGLISFEGCYAEELKTFCTQRGLQWAKEDENDAEALTDLLHKADEEQTFDRFTELPAEMRVMVYGHYLASLPSVGALARPPPITRTSKLLRKEALPMFYASQELRIPMSLCCGYAWRGDGINNDRDTLAIEYLDDVAEDAGNRLVCAHESRAHAFLTKAPQEVLGYIRKVSVVLQLEIGMPKQSNNVTLCANVSLEYDIDLKPAKKQTKYELKYVEGYETMSSSSLEADAVEAVADRFRDHLADILDHRLATGKPCLRRNDYWLLMMFATSCLDQTYRDDPNQYVKDVKYRKYGQV